MLDGEDTNKGRVLFEFTIPPGAKVPIPHYYKDVDEVIYGLEGVTTSIIDGKKVEIAHRETDYSYQEGRCAITTISRKVWRNHLLS